MRSLLSFINLLVIATLIFIPIDTGFSLALQSRLTDTIKYAEHKVFEQISIERAPDNPELRAFIPQEDGKYAVNISIGGTKIMLSLVNQQKEIIACGREVKFTDISTQQGFIDLVHEQIWQLITDTDKKITPTDIELIGVAWPSLVQDNADQRLLFPSFLIPGFNEENGRYDATLFRPKGLSNARIEALHDGASAAVGIFQAQHENPVTDVWVLGLGTGLGEGVVSKGKVRKHLIDI